LVCAAGSRESVLGDLVKDVAIFKAHKAQPVVIASEEETRFDPYAVHVLHIPRASESISLVLCTMAGHLWGYAAARALDKESQFFGHIRSELVARIWSGGMSQDLSRLLSDQELRGFLDLSYRDFCRRKQERRYASSLESDTCANLALLFKYVQGKAPLSDFVVEFDRPPTYENVVDEFLNHLGRAIDDLSRPIDAIKHQAKTVTVGTSRPEGFPQGSLFDVLRELQVGVDQVGFRDVSTLRALQSSVHEVAGYTVYSVEGLDAFGRPHEESRIETLKKAGVAQAMKSRADSGAPLVGNKRTIVMRRELYLGIGKSDQKRLLVLPLLDDRARVTRLLLVHLSFVEHLELGEKQSLLGSKLEEIRNAVEEANVVWEERYLEALSPEFLLTRSVDRIAETIFAIEGASPST
jgi:glucosamine--fructose-6-phosphate aminotransferase (isomerizing)